MPTAAKGHDSKPDPALHEVDHHHRHDPLRHCHRSLHDQLGMGTQMFLVRVVSNTRDPTVRKMIVDAAATRCCPEVFKMQTWMWVNRGQLPPPSVVLAFADGALNFPRSCLF